MSEYTQLHVLDPTLREDEWQAYNRRAYTSEKPVLVHEVVWAVGETQGEIG
jgi:hypothetical protein